MPTQTWTQWMWVGESHTTAEQFSRMLSVWKCWQINQPSPPQFLVACVSWFFPGFHFQWLAEEVRRNLPYELDFRHEARNQEKCATIFRHLTFLKVSLASFPGLIHSSWNEVIAHIASRERCAINRWGFPFPLDTQGVLGPHHPTCVNDGVLWGREGGQSCIYPIKQYPSWWGEFMVYWWHGGGKSFSVLLLHTHLLQVSLKLGQMYSEMIFLRGFIHCDPHPGNVLVRRGEAGKIEIVLLDHGLYTVSVIVISITLFKLYTIEHNWLFKNEIF